MRFHRAEPHPGEERRYTTDPTYRFGTYVITRDRYGWQTWSIEDAPTHTGWWCIGSHKTMSAARIAAQQHQDARLKANWDGRWDTWGGDGVGP